MLEGNGKTIVWNTLSDRFLQLQNSSQLAKFYKNSLNNLNKQSFNFQDKYKIRHLLQGFLVKKKEIKKNTIQEKLLKNKDDKNTFFLTITVTLGCNFGCNYCCQGSEKDFSSIDENLINKIIELYQFSNARDFDLVWYGGEPLLNVNKIIKANEKIKKIVKGKLSSSLLTNGFLLSKNIAKKLHSTNINEIQISIDGSKNEHDMSRYLKNKMPTYEKVTSNINEINNDNQIDLKILIRINIFTSKSDIKQIVHDLVATGASSWGKTSFYLAPITEKVGNDNFVISSYDRFKFAEIYREFIFLSKKHNLDYVLPSFSGGVCTATKKLGATITPGGEIHKCWDTITSKNEQISDLNENKEKIYSEIIDNKWTNFKHTDNTKCLNCKLSPVCGGDCTINHFESDIDNEFFHSGCPPTKFLLKEYLIERAFNHGIISNEDKINFKNSKVDVKDLKILM